MRRITQTEAKAKLSEHHITIVGAWLCATQRTTLRCDICGNEWDVIPNRVLKGESGCPKCSWEKLGAMRRISQEIIEEKLSQRNISIIGKYSGKNKPCELRCNVCDYTWTTTPYVILENGCGCRQCANVKLSTPLHDVSRRLAELGIGIVNPSEYKNVGQNKTLLRCECCGYEWSTVISRVINDGYGCPNCSESSKGESEISAWLTEHGIDFKRQQRYPECRDRLPLPFDFYLLQYQMCIEYDGEQHFHPVEQWGGEEALLKLQAHDRIKTEYCEHNDIELLRIPYPEFDNIPIILNNKISELTKIRRGGCNEQYPV